jgi:hypothetical protein
MVEPEEVEPLATLDQVHDPRLGRLGLQPQVGQQHSKPRQRGLGLPTGPADHQQIIGVPHQRPVRATPRPVQPVQ